MKRMSLSLLTGLMLFAFTSPAFASDITLNGSAQFECNLLAKYMTKRGFPFIRELRDRYNNFISNRYAAKDAEIIVKNKDNAVLLIDTADEQGNFSLNIPDEAYKIVIRFHEREIESRLSDVKQRNYIADLGHFTSNEVDNWFIRPTLTYCTTCSIRYFDTNKQL